MGESSREMRFGVSSPPTAAVQKGRGDVVTAAASAAPSTAGRPIIADETNSSSDFNQWLHAMKMVARLPGGMPPEFRRKLWLALADKYLKAKDVDWEKEEVKCFSEQWREDDEELGIQIVKDLHRTGSSLCSGPAGTINQAKLKRILLGYARFNPEVGYCQGFNMLGALILQVMDKEETESIKVMIYLVEGILPSGYFSGSLGGLQADMAVFRELMTSKLPRLAKHLQKLQGPVENAFEPPLTNVFTMQWFLTMFCTCLPMTCVLRVWDLVLIEGSDVLLRTALVLWSLLEERILSARTADDFYCQMGSFSSELLNGHLVDSNGLIEKVVDLGPITDLQKLRDKHLYNITPFRDKKGLQLYYSDEDGDSDEESKMAVATAWGLRLRRGSAGLGSKSDGKERIALDISLLKKQYDRLRERQRQAHIILTSAVARQGSSPNQASIQMNQLLMGRNAIVTNNGRRLGPPQGAIPPARKPSLPTSKPPKLAQTKKLLSGETLHWRDTDLSKRRRGSLKWKDIKSDSSQSGMEDRPATLVESAPSSRSSSSEAKSKRPSFKATRQRSDSSSYSEESDGNSSTSTSLCDEDDMPDHNNVSSLEGSPMRKTKSSKKHSEVTKQKSLEDVLNSNDGQPTVDNQIPFIQLTTIESPVLNANKTDIDPSLDYANKEDSETESNRLDYAGFVDEFSWPDINEQPTTSVSLEDTTVEAISEGDFLSLSNVITCTSQLSPMPDITTYINNSNISPLRTPISGFDYTNLVVNINNDSKKFDINEEGVTNEYFERVNVVERPTKLDLLYSLNEEDSIRNAYVSCEPTPESPKNNVVEKPKEEEEESQRTQASDEELDRKMKVLLEYSNKSSLSFIAEAKQEFSAGKFKEMEFDVDSLKYQPSEMIPMKRVHAVESPEFDETDVGSSNTDEIARQKTEESPPKNLAEELMEIELQTKANEDKKNETHVNTEEQVHTGKETTNNSTIPSTEDLETRFRALEMSFSGRKESLRNEQMVRKNSQSSHESFRSSRNSIGDVDGASKRSSIVESSPKHVTPQTKSPEYLTTVNEVSNYDKELEKSAKGEDRETTEQLSAVETSKTVEPTSNGTTYKETDDLQAQTSTEMKYEKEIPQTDEQGLRKEQSSRRSSDYNELKEPQCITPSLETHQPPIEEHMYPSNNKEKEQYLGPSSPMKTESKSILELSNDYDSQFNYKQADVNMEGNKESINRETELSPSSLEMEQSNKEPKLTALEEPNSEQTSFDRNEGLSLYSPLNEKSTVDLVPVESKSEQSVEEKKTTEDQYQYQFKEESTKERVDEKEVTNNDTSFMSEQPTETRTIDVRENSPTITSSSSTQGCPKPSEHHVEDRSDAEKKSTTEGLDIETSPETKHYALEETQSDKEDQEKTMISKSEDLSLNQAPIEDNGETNILRSPKTLEVYPVLPQEEDVTGKGDLQLQCEIDDDDSNATNLSDDRKQLLLPKEAKNKNDELLTEGVTFYEHHPAIENGVEAGGVNDPQQTEIDTTKAQSEETVNSKAQEKTPIDEGSSQPESAVVQSTSNNSDRTIQRKPEETEQHSPLPTSVEKPLSTYSFSYTQNHLNDSVSFLSEIRGMDVNQNANAIQNTLDLQDSPQNLFAVTTSVSLRNSTTIKSSVSVKSSVSMKSSALYDRERSLQVNTGITVIEDPKREDSNRDPSNQLELSQNTRRSNQEAYQDNTNAGVTINVVNSDTSAKTSSISLSMRLPGYAGDYNERKHSRSELLTEPKAFPQILDKTASETSEKEIKSEDQTQSVASESLRNSPEIKSTDESQKRKSSYSQEVEDRLNALERRLSERALTVSKDKSTEVVQGAKEEKEATKEKVSNLEDVEPMKLKIEKASPTDTNQKLKSEIENETKSEVTPTKEETHKVVPSTAELEHRFQELERKLSEKNIHIPAKIDQSQQEHKKTSSTTNPSIVLPENKEDSLKHESKTNEEPPPIPRSRIPSTEDLESRFEALEIQKPLRSPTNLLSPSKIKEDFSAAVSHDPDSKRKSEIPSTEDLESRFQALEQSKISRKSQSKENLIQKAKPKDGPKVTFAETNNAKEANKNSEEKPEIAQKESPTTSTTELSRERVLRKVPSARDLEARFEALEKRKSFTGFSSKTQEHLLAEQSRNFLSSESLNTVDSLKRRELCEKKVASTEDLVLRLDALEQRLAITENSIKNKMSSEATDDLSQTKKAVSPKVTNFECRFEALDERQTFREPQRAATSRENLQTTKDTTPETKLSMIKRSLFEPEPEPKWLPSTQDLENRFDALERQKTKSLGGKPKATPERREPIKTETWEVPFEQIEHRTPSPFGTKPLPRWDNETTLSKFPSTRNLESRFEALEQQKLTIERRSNSKSTGFEVAKPTITQKSTLEQPAKAHSSRSIDLVLEQISTKTAEIEREHQLLSKVPSTQDLEIRYNDLQLHTKRGEDCDHDNDQNLEQTTDSIELTGNHKRRDLYKLESQSDETLTVSHPTGTEFDTKSESRPTSCPEYRDPFDSNFVTTDRVLKIIEENSKILHRILKKTLADSGGGGRGGGNDYCNSTESRSGFTDSLLALGNIFPRSDESISPSRIKSQSPRVRSTITFRSDDSSITDRLASIKSTIKSIDTLCEDQSSRKDKCQRYIDSLFTTSTSPRSSNATSPIPIPIQTSHHLVASRPIIRIDEFEGGRSAPLPTQYQERVAMREMKKEVSPRRRRDEEREEYESRVRRDMMMPNRVDDEAPSDISCSLENIANNKVDSEVDRINQKDKKQVVETQLERSVSPYYAPGSDLHNRSTTPVVYVPSKLEIRHTTVTSTFYDRYLTEKHIERTFPRSKKHSPAVSPTITKSQLDISSSSGSASLDERSSKSAENSPSRRKVNNNSGADGGRGGGGLSPNQTTTVSTAVAYKRSFISAFEVAQKDLHIRSCDNILLQLRSSTLSNQQPLIPSMANMVYNPLPISTKMQKSPELGITLGLYNDETSSKS